MFSHPSLAPEGLRFLHIHHIGELEESSVLLKPRAMAFCRAARWFASTDQSQLDEAGSVLSPSSQYPCTR